MKRNTKEAPARHEPGAPVAATAPNLGERLRQLRFERKLTITQVAALTGIAKSTLSRVESDQLSLTYDKMVQLCRGLRIDLADLFDRPQPANMTRRGFTPAGGGRVMTVGSQQYNYLCTELAGKKMTPMSGIIHSRTLAETNGLLRHEGEEFTYVLEGKLELHTEFYEPLVLDTGGAVYFDSTMGHAYVSVGSTPLKILCVCSTAEPVLTQSLGAFASAPPPTARAKRKREA
jgi:mannose-6-phosphate isomerase-like protein (cupin superfamily)/DNA-binding XRE family transcriptional regulator